jgi:hypothetical protein
MSGDKEQQIKEHKLKNKNNHWCCILLWQDKSIHASTILCTFRNQSSERIWVLCKIRALAVLQQQTPTDMAQLICTRLVAIQRPTCRIYQSVSQPVMYVVVFVE